MATALGYGLGEIAVEAAGAYATTKAKQAASKRFRSTRYYKRYKWGHDTSYRKKMVSQRYAKRLFSEPVNYKSLTAKRNTEDNNMMALGAWEQQQAKRARYTRDEKTAERWTKSHNGEVVKTSFGKRAPAKKNQTKIDALEDKVKELSKELKCNAPPSVMTYRYGARGQKGESGVTAGKMETFIVRALDTDDLEAAWQQLRFWNEETAAYVVSNAAKAQVKDLCVRYHTHKLHLKALDKSFNVRVYLVKPRADTTVNPQQAYTNGMSDSVFSTSTIGSHSADPRTHLTDSEDFRQLYTILHKAEHHMKPGETYTIKTDGKINSDFTYEPLEDDILAGSTDRKNHSLTWVVQIFGDLAYDTADVNRVHWGSSDCAYLTENTLKIHYQSGGPPTRYVQYVDDVGQEALVGSSRTHQVDDADQKDHV